MGAIDIATNQHVYPKMAEKGKKYKCPDCGNPCIFKKGNIKVHHFAHKSESNCSFFDKPSESQIHKEAKRQFCDILQHNYPIHAMRYCDRGCASAKKIRIEKYYTETCSAKEEYSFPYNDSVYRADIALVDNNQIKLIVEICHLHKTSEERRPEPWIELDAEDLIETINDYDPEKILEITCIRSRLCDYCLDADKIEEEKKKIMHEIWEKKHEAWKKKLLEDAIKATKEREEKEAKEKKEKEEFEVSKKRKEEEWLIWEEKMKNDRIERERIAEETRKKMQEEKDKIEYERLELLKNKKEEKAKKLLEKKKKEEEIKNLLEKKKKEEEIKQYENALKSAKTRLLNDEEKKCLIKVDKLKQQNSLLNWMHQKKNEEKVIEVNKKIDSEQKSVYACDFCDELFEKLENCFMHEKYCLKKPKPKFSNTNLYYSEYTNNDNSCRRCGRAGHYKKYCKSTWHVDGYELWENHSESD